MHTTVRIRLGTELIDEERRVVVIGSGPAGTMAALGLVENGIPVTMLESGLRPLTGLQVRMAGTNVYKRIPNEAPHLLNVESHQRGAWKRAFVPGGMSNFWNGNVPRFGREDFTEGERLHDRYRWPLGYDDLAPSYDRVERLLGVAADTREFESLPAPVVAYRRTLPRDWQRIAGVAALRGHGLTPVPRALGSPWTLARSWPRFNSFAFVKAKLCPHPQFELRLGAHALQLEWSASKKQVESVLYEDRLTGQQGRLRAAAVVLAAGPLYSPKLMLDSTSCDFPDGLGNTEGLLGRYLHDHTYCRFRVKVSPRISKLLHVAYFTRAPYADSPPLAAAGSLIGLGLSGFDQALGALAGALAPKADILTGLVIGTMVPVASNGVFLSRDAKDAFGLPQLEIHLTYDSCDVAASVAGRAGLVDVLDAAGFNPEVKWTQPELIPGQSFHYGGTIRMHALPRYGMSDGWGRLHNVRNVMVADASTFTTAVEKNPTLTVMALALRASERLAADLKAGLLGAA